MPNSIVDIIKDIQKGAPNQDNNIGGNIFDTGLSLSQTENKPSFYNYSLDSQSMAYATLSNGEKVQKYESYIPGTDNMERLAQQQTTGDKWINGLEKFGLKTLNAVVGGTAGVVAGLGSAVSDGKMSSIYDNNFSNWLNDLDTKLNYKLPNYYTQQERDKGLGGQMLTANFWSDKFLGGLSFTTGAIVSEGIWAWATGGASLAQSGARLGAKLARGLRWGAEGAEDTAKVLGAMNKYKSIFPKNIYSAEEMAVKGGIIGGKVGEVANLARFTMTSAGYESSVEALQFKRESEEKFLKNFVDLNGRQPTTEETTDFYKKLEQASNDVFLSNMAIVGSSNLVTMGSIFKLSSPIKTGMTDFLSKKAFGEVATRTARQKFAKNAFSYFAKPALTEGLFEEGLQGVTQKFNNRWIEHTYDKTNTHENFDNIGELYNSMAEQYGTKEGWVENGLGMIIGIVGGARNSQVGNAQEKREEDYKNAVETTFDQKTIQGELILPKRLQMMNQITGFAKEAQVEAKKGNIVKSQLAQNDVLLSFINAKLALGSSTKEVTKEIEDNLNSVTSAQWSEAGIENVEDYKADTVKEFKRIADSYDKHKTYWNYIVGKKLVGEQNLKTEDIAGMPKELAVSNNQLIIDSLTWTSVRGENSAKYMNDIQDVLVGELGVEYGKTLKTLSSLLGTKGNLTSTLNKNRALYNNLVSEKDKLVLEIEKLNAAPKETEGVDTQKTRLASLSKSLLDTNNKIQEVSSKIDSIASKISDTQQNRVALEDVSLEGNLAGTYVSGQDLINLEENIKKFKATIDYVKNTDQQRGQYLEDMMDEYNQAQEVFLLHNASSQMASQAKLQDINTWVGAKFLKKNKEMNPDAMQWFTEVANKYKQSKATLYQDFKAGEDLVSDEDFNTFQKDGEVTQDILDKIAQKVKNEEELTENEQAIYKGRKEQVDAINKDTTKPNDVTPLSVEDQIKALEEERAQRLAEGSDSLLNKESEIKKINEERKKALQKVYPILEAYSSLEDLNKVLKDYNLEDNFSFITELLTNNNIKVSFDGKHAGGLPRVASMDTAVIDNKLSNILTINKYTFDKYSKEQKVEVIAHEFVHGLIKLKLNEKGDLKGTTFYRGLENIFKDVRKTYYEAESGKNTTFANLLKQNFSDSDLNNLGGMIKYIESDIEEFATLGLTDTTFIKFLKLLKGNGESNQDNLWTKLAKIVSDFIGISNTKFNELLNYMSENLDTDINYTDDINSRYDSQIEGLKQQSTTKTIPNQTEIDKINKEYDKKINALKGDSKNTLIDQYKQKVETLLKGQYEFLGYTGVDLSDKKPTAKDLEEYRSGNASEEIVRKLQDWKLLDTAVDDNYISIAEMLDIIAQHEKEVSKEETKSTLTDLDAEFIASGERYDDSLLQNTTMSVTGRFMENGDIRFSHLKLATIHDRIGGEITINEQPATREELENLIANPNESTRVTIGDLSMTLNSSGQIGIKYTDFVPNRQRLNMYLINPGSTSWTYKNMFEWNGQETAKIKSDFIEDINPNDLYDLEIDDEVSFVLYNEDGYNDKMFGKLSKQDFTNQVKIMVVKNGKNLSVLKAGNKDSDETIKLLREQAYKAYTKKGNKVLGKTKIEQVLLGTPEIKMDEAGNILQIPVVPQVVEATGFIQDDQVTTSIVFPEGKLNTSFLKKIAKENKGQKVPFVVVKRGAHTLAYPVSMTKVQDSKAEELKTALQQSTTQKQAIAVNELIDKYNIETEKVFPETLEDNLDTLEKAFTENETFLSMEEFTSANYDLNNLANDATTNIDLADLENAISDAKLRISLKAEDLKVSIEAKEMQEIELPIDEQGARLLDETYNLIYQNAPSIFTTNEKFAEIVVDGFSMWKDGKLKVLIPSRAEGSKFKGKEPLEEYKSWTIQRRDSKIMIEALNNLFYANDSGKLRARLNKAEKQALEPIFKRLEAFINRVEQIKNQTEVSKEQKENGEEKICKE